MGNAGDTGLGRNCGHEGVIEVADAASRAGRADLTASARDCHQIDYRTRSASRGSPATRPQRGRQQRHPRSVLPAAPSTGLPACAAMANDYVLAKHDADGSAAALPHRTGCGQGLPDRKFRSEAARAICKMPRPQSSPTQGAQAFANNLWCDFKSWAAVLGLRGAGWNHCDIK